MNWLWFGWDVVYSYPLVGLTATPTRLVFKPLLGRRRVIERASATAVLMESVNGVLMLG